MSLPSKTPAGRFTSVVLTAPFVLLAIVLYWPVLGGLVPLATDVTLEQPIYRSTAFFPDPGPHAEMSDLTRRIYPWRQYATQRLASGSLPEWNPWTLGGAPFLANAQTAVFYPLHFLYSIVDVPTAWSLMFLLHLALAGTFTAFFLREIECDTAAAIGGGLVFALCGFMTAWRGYPLGATATWLPLVAFAVVRLRRAAGPGPVALAAFALAMPVFGGHLETAAQVTLVGLALAAFEAARGGTSSFERTKFLASFTFAALLGALLTAIQWLPAVEWISMTVANLDVRWPVPPLAEAIAFLSRDMTAHPNADGVAVPEAAAYVGVLPLVLAPIAVIGFGGFGGLRGYGVFFAAAGALGASIVYGIGPAGGVVDGVMDALPGVGGIEHARLLLVVDFSLAVLAGIGLTTVARAPENGKWVWLGGPLLASLTAGVVYGLAPGNEGLIGGLALMSVVLILVRSVGLVGPPSFLFVALVILLGDLATFSYASMPFVERETIFPQSPVMAFLEEQAEAGGRTMFLDGVGNPNLGLVEGVEMLSGDDGVLRDVRAFLSGYADPGVGGLAFSSDALIESGSTDRRLDMFNVRFVVAPTESAARIIEAMPLRFAAVFVDGGVGVLVNRRALPRAYLVPARGMEFIGGWRDRIERVRDPAFDPETTVVLPSEPALAPGLEVAPPGAWNVEIVESTDNRTLLEVQTGIASVLVLGQVSYPGWRVTVNGREREVGEANVVLSGIGLDAGSHVVELEFDSRAVRTGATMSLAGMLLIISLIVVGRRIPVFSKGGGEWEAANGTVAAVVVISLVAFGLTALVADGYRRGQPAPPVPDEVAMEVVPQEVTAGEGSYAIRFDGLWDVDVPIRYTLDDGGVEAFTVYLDRNGDQGVTRLDVPPDTPRGVYRFLEVQLPGTRSWVEIEGSVTVR